MTNKEIVMNILNEHPCLTGVQIHDYAYRKFKVTISPQAIAGVLRPLAAKGFVAQSKHPENNRNVYWFTDLGKEKLANEFSL